MHTPQSLDIQTLAMPPRSADSHKGLFGRVLVVGGDYGFGGAAMLACEAASRTGAGLVSCATRAEHISALLSRSPNVMAQAVAGGLELLPHLARASVLAVGPGLGKAAWAELLLQQCLLSELPLVLDADGLNILARPNWQQSFAGRTVVLTPHPAEAGRLLSLSTSAVQANRQQSALALAQQYQATVILKGQHSVVADASGRLALCPYGNPGMSSGGMGDVLTGVVAALLAQGQDAWQAACLAVCVHSKAADDVTAVNGPRGLLAQDLMPYLQRNMNL